MHIIKITPNLLFVYKRQIYQIAESNRIEFFWPELECSSLYVDYRRPVDIESHIPTLLSVSVPTRPDRPRCAARASRDSELSHTCNLLQNDGPDGRVGRNDMLLELVSMK